ncbi:prepilin-type N-terminal cleavage/methylation domain-containing protein [Pseudomonas sp. dw_358]|uniref:PilW family protein n=1 Tax=Pseudomonas sp. dw_358 TaxID=2720083 RepID=UPI001BD66D16|nr:prepilin-type N-terminal cleavage/methylation domain-containing protein [Pseudomonas sp. dw_358]
MSSRKRLETGFSLIELIVAMSLGMVVTLGIMQVFLAARSTYVSQNAAAAIQEDGRFALSKMMQEIRMVGMFGCLTPQATDAIGAAAPFLVAQVTPITYVTSSTAGNVLTLTTADVGSNGGTPTWTIVTDCVTSTKVYVGTQAAGAGQMAIPVRQVIYTYLNNQILTTVGNTTSVLINNVTGFDILFGLAATATDKIVGSYSATALNPALIRSIRLKLTLSDPAGKVAPQTFTVVASLRNRTN